MPARAGRARGIVASIVSSCLAALLMCMALFLATGCGGGELPAVHSSSAPGKARIKVRVVTNKEFGFRMAYPDGWVSSTWKKPVGASAESPMRYMVAYADQHGAQADGVYVDAEQVAVYELDKAVDSISEATAQKIVEEVILAGLPTASILGKGLEPTTVRGVSGWHLLYQYPVHDKNVRASSILLVRGHSAYWITAQADVYSWDGLEPAFDASLSFFRLL